MSLFLTLNKFFAHWAELAIVGYFGKEISELEIPMKIRHLWKKETGKIISSVVR